MAIERLILPKQGLALPNNPEKRRQVIDEALAFAEVTDAFMKVPDEKAINVTPDSAYRRAHHEIVPLEDGTGVYRQIPKLESVVLFSLREDGLLVPHDVGKGRSEHLGIDTDLAVVVAPVTPTGKRHVFELLRHVPGEPPSPDKTKPRNRKG